MSRTVRINSVPNYLKAVVYILCYLEEINGVEVEASGQLVPVSWEHNDGRRRGDREDVRNRTRKPNAFIQLYPI